jgi:hypothetical protein
MHAPAPTTRRPPSFGLCLRREKTVMALSALNAMPAGAAREEFMRCCGCAECAPAAPLRAPPDNKRRTGVTSESGVVCVSWRRSFASKLADARPFASPQALQEAAQRVWWHEARARAA